MLDFSNHFVHINSAPFSQQACIEIYIQPINNQAPSLLFFSSNNPFHLDVAKFRGSDLSLCEFLKHIEYK